MQQAADFFCKEILPGQHRLEDPISNFRASGSEGTADPTDRESVSLGGASPLSPTIFVELKPQQTGSGLLIRYGEVATTSGSTNFLPGRLIAGHRPLKASVVVRVHPRQPLLRSPLAQNESGSLTN